ncbi:MAG: MBL fold metallo-hydrolase [Spirochaetales bacterium]|nr:MBL fold metallo-hydrolase [Spirochaetales bacterium]
MPSLNLSQLSASTYFIPSPSNVGLYVEDNQAILIDSGNDKEAGRQILKILKEKDWKLSLIVNTHSNADHIGGNEFIQKRTKCRIAATAMEASLTENPILESTILTGGYPNKRLRNKFLLAKPSSVTDIIPNSGQIPDTSLKAVPLPGHFLNMIAVETSDSVLFTADSIISEEILSKYHIHFLYDVKAHFETLEMLKKREDKLFVPSHGKPAGMDKFRALVDFNEHKISENIAVVLDSISAHITSEDILAKVCMHYGIELNANQYVLIFSTIRSILSYLLDEKQVEVSYDSGRMLWSIK